MLLEKDIIRKSSFGLLIFILLAGGLTCTRAYASDSKWPESLILLPENENAIVVEKKTQSLFIYTNKNNKLSMVTQMACSTGEAAGMKLKAGDKKTPEGVYFLIDEFEDRYLTPIYGKKAFPTDYPNLIDKREGKNGSAIWIHGTNKPLKPMDSNGCVALENNNILKLDDYITLHSTPVIMVESMHLDSNGAAEVKESVTRLISQWLQAIKTGTYHQYLSFYSPDYLPDIQWWEEWRSIRKDALAFDPQFQLHVHRTGVYRHQGIVTALFEIVLDLKDTQISIGKRKLFINISDPDYKIVGDTFQQISKDFQKTKNPLIAAIQAVVKPQLKKDLVLKTVQDWIAAWTSRDMNKYASYYAKNFYSDNLSKSQWVRRKKSLARKYNYINVSGSDFKVTTNGKKSEVVFFQEYESSGFSTQGTKTLKLVDEGGLWKIYRESWKEK